MEVRHNTKFLEEAVALVVRRAEIPSREAEALAAERIARAAAKRRLATGLAISFAALGIGVALWLARHSGDIHQVTVKEPYPVPGPTVTVTPAPIPTVTVTPTPQSAPSFVTNPAPTAPSDTHAPVINYTKFASQKVFLFGRGWDLQAGHQFASEIQRDWDAAWCYLIIDVGGVTVRADLANRSSTNSAPVGPIANAETLQRIGITDGQASEMASQCPWLDGRRFLPNDLIPVPNRVPSGTVPAQQPTSSFPALSPLDGIPTSIPLSIDAPSSTPELFTIKDGYDAIGNDLPEMPVESSNLEDCQNDCAANFVCNAFTYNKKLNKCFLKARTRILVASVRAVAGYKPGEGGADKVPLISTLNIRSKSAVTGNPYRSVTTQTFDACLVICENDKMYCVGANYENHSLECNLFNNVTGIITAPTMSSADRTSAR